MILSINSVCVLSWISSSLKKFIKLGMPSKLGSGTGFELVALSQPLE